MSGGAIAHSSARWPTPARAHLQDQVARLPVGPQHRQRQAELVVEGPGGRHRGACVGQHAGEHVLGRGLALGAGDREDPEPDALLTQSLEHVRARAPAAPPGRRPPARWAHLSLACRGRQRRRPRPPPRRSRGRRRAHRRRRRTGRPARASRLSRNAGPVTQVGRRGVHHPAADDAGDLLQGHRDHAVRSSLGQRGAELVAVVEGVHGAGDLLAGLVPLAGDHDGVAGARHLDGPPDRRTTVADLEHLGRVVDLRGTGEHGRPDRGRVLGPGVVVGHHEHVGQARPDLAHHRPLAGVPVASGTDDQHQPALGQRAQRGERGLHGVGLVGVVDDRQEVLARVDLLEPARGPRHRGRSRRRPAAGRARPRPPARSRTGRWRR